MTGYSFLLEMQNITKKFPGVLANDSIDFSVKPGEIHMLLGENGSGKSTLMNILSGLYRPDGGSILVRGQQVEFKSPRDAIDAGIGMVHQHFKLVDTFTVSENIVLGTGSAFNLQIERIHRQIKELSSRYGLTVNPAAKIWQLSVGEKQRVEILKLLYRGAGLLVLDEPTAVLTPQESRDLFENLRVMARKGRGIVVITHKLHEVMEAADRVTVLRSGKAVATREKENFSRHDLAWLMVGKDVVFQQGARRGGPGRKVLELSNVKARDDNFRPALNGISFDIREGEIFGIAGVAGNGQRELAETITGLRKCVAGNIYLNNEKITNLPPGEITARRVGHVPEDRLGQGLVPGLGVVDNVILKGYKDYFSRGPFLDYSRAFLHTRELLDNFNIKLGDPGGPVSLLSGGNLQRLLLAREMSFQPVLLVAVYPIRGLDVGAIQGVHNLLLEQRNGGAAVLLISEDLEEIFQLSDRIGVLYEGQLSGVLETEYADLEQIGLMMMGAEKTGEMHNE